MRFQGKTVLITGAGGGIGRATALEFAREGAWVIAADWNATTAEETAATVRAAGGTAEARRVDVGDAESVRCLFADLEALHVAVNGAAINQGSGPIEDIDFADFRRTIDINLSGLFLCLQQELRLMKRQGHGAIVNIASQAGHEGPAFFSPYSASKHAVVGLTKVAALEVARSNIQVNAISPGAVDGGMLRQAFASDPAQRAAIAETLPTGRLVRLEQVARAILFLASEDAAQFIGQSLRLDGGHADVKPSTLWQYAEPAADAAARGDAV